MDQEQELRRLRDQSLYYCNRLLNELNENKEEAATFFGGDICRAYVKATEAAINKAKRTKGKIQNI